MLKRGFHRMAPLASARVSRLTRWLPSATLLILCGCLTATTAGSAPPRTARVNISIQAPAELATVAGQHLDARLYRFDPRLADTPASLIDSAMTPFAHRTGEATSTLLTLGSDTVPAPDMGYYVTVFVLADGRRTHIGEADGEPGLMRVLTDGHPGKLTVVLRPLR
jgi:hypothetical protein